MFGLSELISRSGDKRRHNSGLETLMFTVFFFFFSVLITAIIHICRLRTKEEKRPKSVRREV